MVPTVPAESFKPSTQRVIAAAATAGIELEVRRYPEGTRTAEDAAAAIGCPVDAIAKSIVLHDEQGPLLVFTAGGNRVSYAKVADLLGGGPVRRATAEEARTATSYAVGGTSPFGHPEPLRMLMDHTLEGFETVWASAGTPDTVFPITPAQLREATGATPADVAE